MPAYMIRRLGPDDADLFRTLRLEALANAPEAFGSTYAEDAAKPAEWYMERLAKDVLLTGWLDGETAPSGVAGYFSSIQNKVKHKAHIYTMYVAPRARGTGMAAALVNGLCEHAAKAGFELIQLGVITQNEAAIRLYEGCGFLLYGTEPKAMKYRGQDYDERLYWKPLA